MRMKMKMRMRMRMTMAMKINKKDFLIIYDNELNDNNRQEILEKAKKIYSKEKAAEYCLQNREVIKEKARNRCKNLSEKIKKQNQRVSKEKVSRIDSIQKRSTKK